VVSGFGVGNRGLDLRSGRRAAGRARALGAFAPACLAVSLAGCAVGPDFLSPPPPPVTGYLPGKQPATTTAASDGGAQKFLKGRDIPGAWWRLFHSRQLDRLIAEALAANPSLQAAQATLWQAQENLYAQAGMLLPTIDAKASATRQQFSPSQFGAAGTPNIFNLFQASVNVAYTPDVFGGRWRQIEAS